MEFNEAGELVSPGKPGSQEHPIKQQKLVATWECVVTETDGDSVWCDAYPLDGSGEDGQEFWEIEVPGNKWTEGHAFYVLRSR